MSFLFNKCSLGEHNIHLKKLTVVQFINVFLTINVRFLSEHTEL